MPPRPPRGHILPVPGHSGALSPAGCHPGPGQCPRPGRASRPAVAAMAGPSVGRGPAGPQTEMPTALNGTSGAGSTSMVVIVPAQGLFGEESSTERLHRCSAPR